MAYDDILVKNAASSKIIEIMLRDSTTGGGKTGLVFSDMTGSYCREGGTRQAISVIAGTVGNAYSSGKFAEVDATNQKGLYQFHVPNAAFETGVNSVTITLQAAGMIDKSLRVLLIDADLRDGVHLGITGIPNAAGGAKGGLPILDVTDGLIIEGFGGNPATIAPNAGSINNAAFNADVGSTAYATNIIALAVRKVLDELNLNHLMKDATVAADMTAELPDDTVLARIIANGDTSTFVPSTDGLHAAGVDLDAILLDTGTTLDGRIPAALVSGRMDSSVGAIAANAITAASVATDAIDADAIAASAATEIQGITTHSYVGSVALGTNITLANLTPIEDARCFLSSDEDGDNAVSSTVLTDANGEFTLYVSAAGNYYVQADKAGYVRTTLGPVAIA